jgi:hypothetical protein
MLAEAPQRIDAWVCSGVLATEEEEGRGAVGTDQGEHGTEDKTHPA